MTAPTGRKPGAGAMLLGVSLLLPPAPGLAGDTLAPAAARSPLTPPMARRKPRDVSVHGERRIDDYHWLRERDNPQVRAYLQAEAAHTAAWMEPYLPFSELLYQEMLGRIKQDDESVPVRDGDWWYFTRHAAGAQYPVHLRRPAQGMDRHDDPTQPAQVLLDLNELARGRKYLALGGRSVSPDGRRMAYSVDTSGARDFLLLARDIASGRELPVRIERCAGFEWSADGSALYYLSTDRTRREYRLWRHVIGAHQPDQLLFEERDSQFSLDIGHTQDRRFLVLTSASKDTSEIRVLDAQARRAAWRVVVPRRRGREASLEHHDGRFFLLLNDTGRNFRLATLPVAQGTLAQAREEVAARDDTLIEKIVMFRTHYVLQLREQGLVRLRVVAHEGGARRDIAFDEAAYGLEAIDNPEVDSDTLRLRYESLATPPTLVDVRLDTLERRVRKVEAVQGGFDAARYASQRLWVTAADGTRVPVSLVWRRDLRQPGPQPLLLYGYGAYGLASDAWFSSPRLSLLDRGVVFAIAHVRGGGDLGRAWYDAGKLAHKMNSFTDFIAVADALVAQGWTTPGQLIAEGASAGGLLMAAATNLRPDLFHAVVAEVPFVDVINTMLDESIPLTTGEFIEWGNPKIAAQYRWMRAYSPYDNLRPGRYPALYVQTSLNDSQVGYWEPAKYVARLRRLKTDDNPLLLDINMDAGHGGSSGRFDAMRERARTATFMLQQWGLLKPPEPYR